jgi:hypothetical protein
VEFCSGCRGGIALDAAAELVDLVEHQHRVARAGLAQRLDDVARQRADVGAPVAADLGLVVRAAEARALELESQRAGDALPERGLAHARGTHEAQDRAAALGVQLAHGEVLYDALLDLLEAVVVRVEDAARAGDIDRLIVELRPRQGEQRVEVGARHRVLAARLVHPLEALQLLARVFLDVRRHAGLRDRFAELGDLLAAALVTKLALDLAQLLAQHDLALAVVDRVLGLLLDLARELEHLDALREQRRDALEALAQVQHLEQLLLLGGLHVQEARDRVGERRRRFDGLHRIREFRRGLRQQRDRLGRLLLQVQRAGLDLRMGGAAVVQVFDPGDQVRETAHGVEHAKAPFALADEVVRAVRGRDVTEDARDRADPLQVVEAGILGLGVLLQQEPDLALGADGLLRPGDGLLALDRHRQDDAREEHHVAHRQHEQHVIGQARQRLGLGLGLAARGSQWDLVRAHPFTSTRSAPGQQQLQATIRKLLGDQFPPPGRQGQAPLEAAVRNLEPLDRGIGEPPRQPPFTRDHQFTRTAEDLDALRRDARQRHLDQDLALVPVDVGRRFPARALCAAEPEELPLQALGLLQQVHRLAPDPGTGIASCHRESVLSIRAA